MDDWGEHFALRVNDDDVDIIEDAEDDGGFFKTRLAPGRVSAACIFRTKYKKGLG